MSRVWKSAGLAMAVALAVMGGASAASADARAVGVAAHSPGVLSGNLVQVPIHLPVNLCGNSVSLIGAANPATGNVCVNA